MSYRVVDSYKQDTSEPLPATGDPEFTHQQNNSGGGTSDAFTLDLGDADPARKIIMAFAGYGSFGSVNLDFTLDGQQPDWERWLQFTTIGADSVSGIAVWDWPTNYTGADAFAMSSTVSLSGARYSFFRMVASAYTPIQEGYAGGSGQWNRSLPTPGAILGVAANDGGTVYPSISNMTSRSNGAWRRISSRVEPDGLATTAFHFGSIGGGGIRQYAIWDLST